MISLLVNLACPRPLGTNFLQSSRIAYLNPKRSILEGGIKHKLCIFYLKGLFLAMFIIYIIKKKLEKFKYKDYLPYQYFQMSTLNILLIQTMLRKVRLLEY